MKFDLISDLHLDFDDKILDEITPNSTTLLLPGDLCEQLHLKQRWIDKLCDLYHTIIYVPGNHEYYKVRIGSLEYLNRKTKGKNWFTLTREKVTIDNVTFAGATGWFPYDISNKKVEKYYSDFRWIRKFKEDVYLEHEKDKQFFIDVSANVWVMHFLPFKQSIHPKYQYANTNCFFYGQFESAFMRCHKAPKVIVHGHTHERMDYIINDTRVVCNPRGYPNENNNVNIITIDVEL